MRSEVFQCPAVCTTLSIIILNTILFHRSKHGGREKRHFKTNQITGCSNLYPLNASQSVSKIRLLVFTVSCFAVNKRAQIWSRYFAEM